MRIRRAFNLFEAAKSPFSPESGLPVSDGSSDSLSPECAKKCQNVQSEPQNQVQIAVPPSSERVAYTSNFYSFSFWGTIIISNKKKKKKGSKKA